MISDDLKKVSALTNLPIKVLENIYDIEKLVVLEEVFKNKEVNSPIVINAYDFGRLIIFKEEGGIKVDFIVSDNFKQEVEKALESKTSLILERASNSLRKKLIKNYKELI